MATGKRTLEFIRLAWRNANGNAFRSWTIFTAAAVIAGFAVAATIVIGGAQRSLNLAMQRLGADIVVVSAGSEKLMENAFLMGVPARTWMPREYMEEIEAIPQVEAVSPQFFLSTLRGANCCSVPEMFLVAYDPETDFTLRPWLEENAEGGLGLGEAVGGSLVYVPRDPGYILVYGYELDLKGNLSPTGTGIDRSMFFTLDTANEIARLSPDQAMEELQIPSNSISAAMVKVSSGSDIHQVAMQIREELPDATPVESSNLFHSQRVQILSLLRSVVALLGIAWVLAVALIGLVFSMAVNERRQEIGVLRALGFTRPFVLQTLVTEGLILALAGGVTGIIISIFAVYLFHQFIVQSMGVPFLIPGPFSLVLLSVAALALTLLSVAAGALLPSTRISRMEPAFAMRK